MTSQKDPNYIMVVLKTKVNDFKSQIFSKNLKLLEKSVENKDFLIFTVDLAENNNNTDVVRKWLANLQESLLA